MKQYPDQWRALGLMVLAWSFAGLAHNCIAFLFPYFSQEMGLTTEHNGYLAAVLAFFWTISIVVSGKWAARIGQIRVITLGLSMGALALALLAAVQRPAALYGLTALAGLGCGSMAAPSLSFLAEQSDPRNRGLFYGMAMSSYTLIGSALGSFVLTRLGASPAGWRGAYLLIGLLVLTAALAAFCFGRGIPSRRAEEAAEVRHSFRELLGYRNVLLSTALACLAMMWYFTVAAFTILYLMESRGLSAVAAGAIFAGFGAGGFVGELGAPIVSDHLGRKVTALAAAVAGTVCFGAFLLFNLPAAGLTLAIAGASLFMSGAMAIVNSVVPSESVPAELVGTATSFTPAAGELTGGVMAPALAGALTGTLGMGQIMYGLLALPVLVALGACFLRETAPLALARRKRSGAE